jgi:PKD domain
MKITTYCIIIALFLPLHLAAQCPNRPVASFRLVENDICFGQSITVINTSTENGNDVDYIWEWGDGTQDRVSNKSSVTHTFNQPINFCADAVAGGFARDITLRMVNRNPQCFGHASKSEIFIYAVPSTNFTFEDVCISNPTINGILETPLRVQTIPLLRKVLHIPILPLAHILYL